jgi:competence protein ComEA
MDRVDLNRADSGTLERLPGIGPGLARRILAEREAHGRYRTPEELLRVPGIGRERLERLRPWITTGEGA